MQLTNSKGEADRAREKRERERGIGLSYCVAGRENERERREKEWEKENEEGGIVRGLYWACSITLGSIFGHKVQETCLVCPNLCLGTVGTDTLGVSGFICHHQYCSVYQPFSIPAVSHPLPLSTSLGYTEYTGSLELSHVVEQKWKNANMNTTLETRWCMCFFQFRWKTIKYHHNYLGHLHLPRKFEINTRQLEECKINSFITFMMT